MPVLTLLAPGTPVSIPRERVAAAVVEWAEMRQGANPLRYGVAWQDAGRGPVHRRAVTADLVEEVELGPAAAAAPPRVTVIAPGSPVRPPMDKMPNARVETVEVRAAPTPEAAPLVKYRVTWHEPDGPPRRAGFRADQVAEAPEAAGRAAAGRTHLAELGRMMADQTDEG